MPLLGWNRIENERGVTYGQMFDLMREMSSVGENTTLTWLFSDLLARGAVHVVYSAPKYMHRTLIV